jgi:hypothetical protein
MVGACIRTWVGVSVERAWEGCPLMIAHASVWVCGAGLGRERGHGRVPVRAALLQHTIELRTQNNNDAKKPS